MENIMWWTLEARGPSRRDGGIWDDSVACYVVTRSSTSLPPPVCLESLQHPALLLNVATRPSCDLSEEFPYSVRAESTDKRPGVAYKLQHSFSICVIVFWILVTELMLSDYQSPDTLKATFLTWGYVKMFLLCYWPWGKKKKLFTDWNCLCLRNIKYWKNLFRQLDLFHASVQLPTRQHRDLSWPGGLRTFINIKYWELV